MTTLEKIMAEITNTTFDFQHGMISKGAELAIIDKYAEQEPCEDAVDRQALVNEFQNTEDAEYCKWSTDGIVSVIKDMPSVQPKAKTGRWIEREDYNQDPYYDCSVCGESWTTIEGTPWNNGMKFCPNCGSAMTEGSEE